MMDRRTFMTSLAVAGLGTGLGLAGYSGPALADANAMRRRALNFQAGLRERPWLLGWQVPEAPTVAADSPEIRVEGRIPDALRGDFCRNGPAGHEVFGHRYRHWFDGDGLVHRFRIADGTVRHAGRIIDTPKWRSEQAALRPLQDAYDTVVDGEPFSSLDALNPGNISIIDHGGKLLALWEGGSAIELDRETLAFRDFVTLSPETVGMPFAAHPRLDRDGTLWSFGTASFAGRIVLYRVNPSGQLHGVHLLDVSPTPMVHDFLITERHLVFILTPWRYDGSAGDTFLERHVWQPEAGGRALIIDKDAPERQRTVELPAFWVYHFGNAWEDAGGIIRFDHCRYADPTMTTAGFRSVMEGSSFSGTGASYRSARIDPARGTFSEEVLVGGPAAEFPRVHPGRIGRRTDRAVMLLADQDAGAAHPLFTTTAMVNHATGDIDAFVHGPTEMAEEAVFVPLGTGDTDAPDGWVLQTVLDFAAARTRLKIFDATNLASGPLAVATLPYALPLGLHGSFMKA